MKMEFGNLSVYDLRKDLNCLTEEVKEVSKEVKLVKEVVGNFEGISNAGAVEEIETLRSEISGLTQRVENLSISPEEMADLKKIAKGERFTIKYANGQLTDAKYNELLEAVKDKEVEEIELNTDGLDSYVTKFVLLDKYFERIFSFDDVEDGTRREEFNNSGFYIDIFDYETKKLVVRNDVNIAKLFDSVDSVNICKYQIKVPNVLSLNSNERPKLFFRVKKYGAYTDYEINFLVKFDYNFSFLSYSSSAYYDYDRSVTYELQEFNRNGYSIVMKKEDLEILLMKELELEKTNGEKEKILLEFLSFSESLFFKMDISKGRKETILTNLLVDDVAYSRIDKSLFSLLSFNHNYLRSGVNDYVGKKYLSYVREGYSLYSSYHKSSTPYYFSLKLYTQDELGGFYKIQLIDTETQEVLFEKDNREEKLDSISVENVEMPKLLTIKLWSNESLLNEGIEEEVYEGELPSSGGETNDSEEVQ